MLEKSGNRGKWKISIRDFGELLRCLGWNPSEIEIEEARHELDSTGTGMVLFNDVKDYVARKGVLVDQSSAEDILAAFQVLGKNGLGLIPSDEFKFFMTTMGEKMSPEEVDELMKEADKDGTGSILNEGTGMVLFNDVKDYVARKVVLVDQSSAEHILPAFQVLGKNGLGRIPSDEFKFFMTTMGEKMSPEEVDELMKEADKDGTGSILNEGTGMVLFNDVKDYVARKGVLVDQSSAEDILPAFQVLGKNGLGRIPSDEFKFFMTTMGEKMSPEKVDELMKEADKDGTGSILNEELLKSTELNDDAG